jgi:D-alanine---D-serine ligase
VKPANGGSSLGITKVLRPDELAGAMRAAFGHDKKVIIEEAVAGFEVGCAVLGNETLTIGAVDEIELSQGFFDFTEKYTLKTSRIHVPARIDAGTADRIRQAAAIIYRVLGCWGFARVDMFLTPENEVVFNEVNTIPGLTAHSRFPNMLKGIGMTFPQMVDELIKLAMQR